MDGMDTTLGAIGAVGTRSTPVVSASATEDFNPEGSANTYTVAPLTFRERTQFRAALAREGGLQPSREDLSEGLRAAIREIAPGNAAELRGHFGIK